MEKEDSTSSLSNTGLEKILPDIQRLLQKSIRISLTPIGQSKPETGCSRFGGLPDLPFGFNWPSCKGIPMSFIAQIRLEDLDGLEPAKKLPSSGLISFFYDANQETYGGSPNDRGGWGVYYFSGLAWMSLHTAAAPSDLPESARFSPCSLSFTSEATLPTSAEQHLDNLNWGEADVQAYEDYLSNFPTSTDYSLRHHRMFGHPNQLQDDMQLQSALYANNVPSNDDPRAAALAQKKEDWLLLLQVDSDDLTGMKWATSGILYFWINSAALSENKFDETWLVLQAE